MICSKCEVDKPRDDFYPKRADCKECVRAYQRSNRFKEVKKKHRQTEKYRKTYEAWRDSDRGKEVRSEAVKRFREKNPEQRHANNCVTRAVAAGHLPKIKTLCCLYCGKQAEHYHHVNGYDKVYDIVPTCVQCHKDKHSRATSK